MKYLNADLTHSQSGQLMNKFCKYLYRRAPILDKEGKFIFFKTTKACQKSIKKAIGDRIITHRRYDKSNFESLIETYYSAFKFTVVRNPWDRVVSTFHYLQQPPLGWINADMSFKHFVTHELVKCGTRFNNHFHHQTPNCIYCGGKNELIVDYIARFETIDADWRYIANKIKVSPVLPHINKSVHKDYKTYYNDECIEIVSNIYKKDIEFLNYKFEQESHD